MNSSSNSKPLINLSLFSGIIIVTFALLSGSLYWVNNIINAQILVIEKDNIEHHINENTSTSLNTHVKNLKQQRIIIFLAYSFALFILLSLLVVMYRCNYQAFANLAITIDDLELTKQRYMSLFDNLFEAVIIINQNGIIDDINPATSELFGYSKDELINQNVSILMPSPHNERHDDYIKRYIKEKKSNIIGLGREVQGLHKNGQSIPVVLSVSEFSVKDKVFFLGSMRDIRAQKESLEAILNAHAEMEERVEERTKELSLKNKQLEGMVDERDIQNRSLRLYSKVFNSASEAIVVTDKDQHIIDVNPAFSRITGYSREEILGYKPSKYASGMHDKDFFKEMWSTLNSTGSWHGEIWDKRKDGKNFPKQLSINTVYEDNGEVSQYIAIFSDITILKDTEKRLEKLAYNDPLTSLNNRTMYHFLLKMTYESAKREETNFALLFIDLDQFKQVNDTLGHSVGDKLLIEVARRLKNCIRKTDIVSRIGGDEFTVILPRINSNQAAAQIAQKIINAISQPIELGEDTVNIGTSIGISIFPQDGSNVEILNKHADIAMYHVKESGRNGYQYFNHSMFEQSQKRMTMEDALRKALKDDQFELYYQPKINIENNEIIGAEALIRWNDPEKGLIPPFEFIPLAESSGLIIPMGEWIIQQACKQLKLWHNPKARKVSAKFRLAINLSPLQFKQENLTELVKEIMQHEGISDFLDIEVTESMLLHDVETVIETLTVFQDMHVGIALDDFGTGFSSLSNLKRLPIQYLKVDRSFIKDIKESNDDATIVSAIVSMGHQLGLKVIAEGIEDNEQLEFMRQLRCDEAQGYFYSPPLPADKFTEFVAQYRKNKA